MSGLLSGLFIEIFGSMDTFGLVTVGEESSKLLMFISRNGVEWLIIY